MRSRSGMLAHILLPITIAIVALIMGQASTQAQTPARGNATGVPQAAVSDPAQVERGKALYGVRCTFCHGADARGGEGGPNLVRSGLVLNDIKGELIAPVLQNGRPEMGMPKFDLTSAQVSDITSFLRTFRAA